MFKEQVRITGRHAEIMKKYTQEKQADTKFPLILNDNRGGQVETYIFDTMYQCYTFFATLGLAIDKKADADNSTPTNANVFADKIVSNQKYLYRIFRQMVLVDQTFGDDLDIKIKMLFDEGSMTPEQKKIGKELFDSYVRGGAEYFDERFCQSHSYEDIVRNFLTLFKENQIV